MKQGTVTTVEGVMVGDELVVESSASWRNDLVERREVELEQTGRLAVEQAVAADGVAAGISCRIVVLARRRPRC